MADTIMMTRRTSTTSTMGVTLMPTIGARRAPRPAIVPAMFWVSFLRFLVGFHCRDGAEAARYRKRRLRRQRTPRQVSAVTFRLEQRRDVFCDGADVVFDVADALLENVVRNDRRDRDEE